MNAVISNATSEYRTLVFSFITIVALMVCGLTFNELTESNILELDAGAYVVSAIIGAITIYISRLRYKPKDQEHPLGFGGFVPVLNLIRSFMIILICLKAIGESLGSIFNGPENTDHSILFLYAGITLLFNATAYLITRRAGLRLKSALLTMDATEWKIDTLYNFSILAAVGLSYSLQFTSYANYTNYIDPVFCIVLSVVMSYDPMVLFSENVKLLSVSTIDKEIQTQITNLFHSHYPSIHSFAPEFNVLHVGGVLWVDVQLRINKHDFLFAKECSKIKQVGEVILSDLASDYRLSFRFVFKEEQTE